MSILEAIGAALAIAGMAAVGALVAALSTVALAAIAIAGPPLVLCVVLIGKLKPWLERANAAIRERLA